MEILKISEAWLLWLSVRVDVWSFTLLEEKCCTNRIQYNLVDELYPCAIPSLEKLEHPLKLLFIMNRMFLSFWESITSLRTYIYIYTSGIMQEKGKLSLERKGECCVGTISKILAQIGGNAKFLCVCAGHWNVQEKRWHKTCGYFMSLYQWFMSKHAMWEETEDFRISEGG